MNGGTLLVNNTIGSGTGDADVTVNGSGTTLGGTGIISERVTVNIGANLAPGNGGHTTSILTVGAVTLAPGANFLVDINGTAAGTGYDRLVVTASGNNRFVITNSNLVVTVGTTLSVGQTFLIGQSIAGATNYRTICAKGVPWWAATVPFSRSVTPEAMATTSCSR